MDIETAKLAFQILQFLITGGIAVPESDVRSLS